MEQQLQLIFTYFYKMDFQKLSAKSKQLHAINDEELRLALNPNLYFEQQTEYQLYDKPNEESCERVELSLKQKKSQTKDFIQLIPEDSILVPHYRQEYSLFIGSVHFYILVKMIAAIYERLVKASSLCEEQCAKEQDSWTGTDEQKQRFPATRFNMFVGILMQTLSERSKMDANAYEDNARKVLGSDAYLLFVLDKLIAHVS